MRGIFNRFYNQNWWPFSVDNHTGQTNGVILVSFYQNLVLNFRQTLLQWLLQIMQSTNIFHHHDDEWCQYWLIYRFYINFIILVHIHRLMCRYTIYQFIPAVLGKLCPSVNIPISHHSIYQSIPIILGERNLLYTIFYYTHSGI